jgi:hypothetical protein
MKQEKHEIKLLGRSKRIIIELLKIIPNMMKLPYK